MRHNPETTEWCLFIDFYKVKLKVVLNDFLSFTVGAVIIIVLHSWLSGRGPVLLMRPFQPRHCWPYSVLEGIKVGPITISVSNTTVLWLRLHYSDSPESSYNN